MNGGMSEASERESSQTSTVVGIDEAGYGPLLGPLVVSAVAFDVPVPVLKAVKNPADGPDLWKLLADSVTPRVAKRDPRLAVADSKKMHGKSGSARGIRLLERAALTFLSQSGETPASFRALLERVCPHVIGSLDDYPWYAGVDVELPADSSRDGLGIQRSAVSHNLSSSGVRFHGAWVEVLTVGAYNRLVSATRNKAVALFGQSTRLIQRIADATGPRPLRVWCDRQGGRTRYRQPLMTAFPDADLDILDESEDLSAYRLTHPSAPWVIRFVKNGETHHLPVALASIISKYIRELFMIAFNRYWSGQVADLRPTAGYYQDGRRFLADIAPAVERLGVDRQRLVRTS